MFVGLNSVECFPMLKYCVPLFVVFACTSTVCAQMQIAERAASPAPQYLSLPAGTQGFLADDFQVGAVEEDWVIDHIRLWIARDTKATSPRAAGELFTRITLFGGIAPDLPTAGEVTCDCHNLPKLRTLTFAGGAALDTEGSTFTVTRQADGTDLWQLDFKDLKWSVPGARPIQFGLLAASRSGQDTPLYYLGSAPGSGQHLRIFSDDGRIQGPLAQSDPGRVDVQVWGHLLAKVSISAAGDRLTVVLHGQPAIQASQVDPASLHFGPSGVRPEHVQVVDSGHSGQPDLLMSVKIVDIGITRQSVNACLNGQRVDGAPFEGCDLLPH
jgi:hypothetical protein